MFDLGALDFPPGLFIKLPVMLTILLFPETSNKFLFDPAYLSPLLVFDMFYIKFLLLLASVTFIELVFNLSNPYFGFLFFFPVLASTPLTI